ncbi:MAG: hypothetical protein GTN93_22990, partial [Anaerolineae bacterium]|nr:hypothetical protein [Anaerolineae bacterium]NIQ80905.1 hypothetical protein [Anaerolineae bacterium]
NQIVNVKVATTYDVKTCIAVGGERLYHGFATTEEGWTARDNGNEPVRWKDSAFCEADAGGCISLSDGSDGWMYFQAPRHWRDGADLREYYGGELQFDMRIAGG